MTEDTAPFFIAWACPNCGKTGRTTLAHVR
jgi:hypothetical protein